ncbi:MAG: anti-sigma factor family protein, partial [Candidatus Hydrogenedentota bacterium]
MAYSNCDEVRLEFSALLDDELSAGERRAIEAHLAECPACRGLFHQFQVVDQLFEDLPQREAPAELEAGIREALTTGREHVKAVPRSRHARQRVWPLLAAAAGFVVLAGGVLLMATQEFGPESFRLARFDEPAEQEEAAPAPRDEPRADVMRETAPDALDTEPMGSPRNDASDDAVQEPVNGFEDDGDGAGIRGLKSGAPEEAPNLEQDSQAQRSRPRARAQEPTAP